LPGGETGYAGAGDFWPQEVYISKLSYLNLSETHPRSVCPACRQAGDFTPGVLIEALSKDYNPEQFDV